MKILISLFGFAFLFGCATQEVVLKGEYKLLNAPSNAQITLSFEDNNFAGSSGVNRYFGTFEQNGNNIKFNTAGLTMMMGPQDLMQAEQKYLKDLSEVGKISFKNNRLLLTDDNGIELEFEIK